MTTFIEKYLNFEKALKWMSSHTTEIPKAKSDRFHAITSDLDKTWAELNKAQRNESASELVGRGVNNSIFHYQLYGKAKKMWEK
jgi:hypothetical protein